MSKKRKPVAGPFEKLRTLRDELGRKEESPAANADGGPAVSRAARGTPPTPPRRPDDDAALLDGFFAGVEPLSGSPGRIPRLRIERPRAGERTPKGLRDRAGPRDETAGGRARRPGGEDDTRFEVGDDGRHVEGRRVDVAIDVVRRLRRGEFPVDARFDLHGMRLQEARGHLELFLRTMRARRERCVLVIHGKGEHSPSGLGVLRGEISAWLSQGTASEHVAAFATARRDDGGEGAMYVLLRR